MSFSSKYGTLKGLLRIIYKTFIFEVGVHIRMSYMDIFIHRRRTKGTRFGGQKYQFCD
jgi:hypothetical protein